MSRREQLRRSAAVLEGFRRSHVIEMRQAGRLEQARRFLAAPEPGCIRYVSAVIDMPLASH